MPLPTAVPRCSSKRSIAASRSSRDCVVGCTTLAVAANATMPMRMFARRVVDERLGRGLRGLEAARLHVGGAHAARDVHRQDDRLVLRRQRDRRGRACRGDDQRGEREQHQRRRNVAPQLVALAQRLVDDRKAGIAQRALLPPAQHQDVERRRARQDRRQPQPFRPEEFHDAALEVRRQRAAARRPARGACADRRSATATR